MYFILFFIILLIIILWKSKETFISSPSYSFVSKYDNETYDRVGDYSQINDGESSYFLQNKEFTYPGTGPIRDRVVNNNISESRETNLLSFEYVKNLFYSMKNEDKEVDNTYESVNCIGMWDTYWSECSADCSVGIRTKQYRIIQPGKSGGIQCPYNDGDTIDEECNKLPCPIDCSGEWDQWTDCNKDCGGGTQTRTYNVEIEKRSGYKNDLPVDGNECPFADQEVETQQCNTGPCPIDCEMSSWTQDTCSATCGDGTRINTRTITTPPQYGGMPCGDLQETQDCNTGPCPIDCEVSGWGAWGPCNGSCDDTGTQTRTRTVTTSAQHGGTCGDLEETQDCNTGPCPIDCVMSDWGAWGPCSQLCGGGTRIKTKNIITQAQYGGTSCGNTEQQENCNTDACPNDNDIVTCQGNKVSGGGGRSSDAAYIYNNNTLSYYSPEIAIHNDIDLNSATSTNCSTYSLLSNDVMYPTINYGDRVVIAYSDDTDNTADCGWYGCNVATIDNPSSRNGLRVLKFGKGNDGNASKGFYLRSFNDSNKTGPIKYGEQIAIAYTSNSGDTTDCGLYGCRVAKMETSRGEHYMRFVRGFDAKPFYIRHPTDWSKIGTDIRYGDEVKIDYTSHWFWSPCGLYGCRVARKASVTLSDDGKRVTRELMKFDHGNSARTFYLRKPR